MPSRLLVLGLAQLGLAVQAAPLPREDVPEPLKPWVDWVLQDEQQSFCPPRYNDAGQRLCHWPSRMQLSVDESGGEFRLEVRLETSGWVELPGDGPRWPQDVTANGRPVATQQRANAPAVHLPPGEYRIDGRFEWSARPESLRVPADTGLVRLRVSGQDIAHPQRDARDQLWLGQKTRSDEATTNRLGMRVFRLIDDDIPMQINTRIEIDAGGEVREEQIGPVLLDGQVPLGLSGPLPARIEPDGTLRLQVRPGQWTMTLVSRSRTVVGEMTARLPPPPWPQQESWSLRAHHELRVVEPEGLAPTDPRQTGVPPEWHAYPAFIADAGKTLSLEQTRRGSADLEPDRLSLSRQLWLDFDGQGYTLQDSLRGQLARTWRLSTQDRLALGRVVVDGTPQLITRHDGQTGVEVRHGNLDLSADGRIESAARRLPVGGWNSDLQSAETLLHLPPAWRVFAAPGVDRVPETWLSRWTLLDLFLVLITTIAAMRLFGWGTAALTLATLALTWQSTNAPGYSWLNLIAAIALLRALPASFNNDGLLYKLLVGYKWLAAAVLVLIAIPFAIEQARISLYPQLDRGGIVDHHFTAGQARKYAAEDAVATAEMAPAEMSAAAPPPMPRASRVLAKGEAFADGMQQTLSSVAPQRNYAQSPIQALDPNALTQTGPGVPDWSWNSVRLQWSGPVTVDQEFELWLMPPWLTRSLGWLSILLIALLAARWLKPELRWPRPSARAGSAAALLLGLALIAPQADAAKAVRPAPEPPQPEQDLLEELRERLTRAPDCMPHCANFSRMRVDVSADDVLSLRLTAEAAVESALSLPLPRLQAGQNRVWQPSEIRVGERIADIQRDARGALWVLLPDGRHEVVVRGSLAGFQELQLPMSPRPQRVTSALSGWLLSGVDGNGQPSGVVTLSREQTGAASGDLVKLDEQRLPPLLRLDRRLQLGLVWEVQSSVMREGDTQSAQSVRVPALPGEVVTGETVRIVDGFIEASLSPGQRSVQWTSRIDTQDTITLEAGSDPDVLERWQLDASSLWHVEFDGIPAVSTQQDQWRLPTWRPWPGEQLVIRVSRPEAVSGRVLTLDAARLSAQPGKRATDLTLELELRASQGGQHALPLPEDLTVQSLRIDGSAVPAQTEGGRLLLPLRPGTQQIHIELRQDNGVSGMTTVPHLDLKIPGVNARIDMELPRDRWVLFTGGPSMGPAVLFWGVLVVLLAIAVALGRVGLTPLGGLQWALLMVGLSQLPVFAAAIVAGWLFALGLRGRMPEHWRPGQFNAVQVLLALWTLAALLTLASAVWQGLLGAPDMQVAGNGSSQHSLHWYQDRFDGQLPNAWAVSVSIWFYHGLMLLWAMWLANSLLNWLRWGWQQYSSGTLWKKTPKVARDTVKTKPTPGEKS